MWHLHLIPVTGPLTPSQDYTPLLSQEVGGCVLIPAMLSPPSPNSDTPPQEHIV